MYPRIIETTADYSNSSIKRLAAYGKNGPCFVVEVRDRFSVSCADNKKLASRLVAALKQGFEVYKHINPRTMNADLKRLGF